ncbi:MAG: hypothetical protein RIT25_376 [Planctomycetota bacterium]|jgi:hypothetical protein
MVSPRIASHDLYGCPRSQLLTELGRAQRALATAERCFLEAALEVADGLPEVPSPVAWHLGFHRRRVAALERALRELDTRTTEGCDAEPACA